MQLVYSSRSMNKSTNMIRGGKLFVTSMIVLEIASLLTDVGPTSVVDVHSHLKLGSGGRGSE